MIDFDDLLVVDNSKWFIFVNLKKSVLNVSFSLLDVDIFEVVNLLLLGKLK